MARKPNHNLRSARRKLALRQRDVAALIGDRRHSRISRFEKNRRSPPLEVAFACELIFGVPMAELFSGVQGEVRESVRRRARELLRDTAEEKRSMRAVRRKRSIEAILAR